jgi:hypothetical protein
MGKPTLEPRLEHWRVSGPAHPAFVTILRRTSIGGPPASTISRRALASPVWTRPAIMSLSDLWASTSRSSATLCGKLPRQLKRTALFHTEEVTCSRQLRQRPHRIFLRRDAASVPGYRKRPHNLICAFQAIAHRPRCSRLKRLRPGYAAHDHCRPWRCRRC